MKTGDNEIMQNAYWVTYIQCSEPLWNYLDAQDKFLEISKDGNVIGLIKLVKQMCYNFQSHNYAPQAIHDNMRKFELLQQDMHQLNSYYLKFLLSRVGVIESIDANAGVHQSLLDVELAKVQTRYEAADNQSKREIYTQCQMTASQQYLATCYLMGADQRRCGSIITDMENNYPHGNDQWPRDMTKAHALLVNWKVNTKRGKEG